MAIIKRSLGNNRQIIAQKFRETGREDGLGGLAFSMFCNGWKLAWEECINQSPKLKEAENERLKLHIKSLRLRIKDADNVGDGDKITRILIVGLAASRDVLDDNVTVYSSPQLVNDNFGGTPIDADGYETITVSILCEGTTAGELGHYAPLLECYYDV